jgi:tetratricopeptide (TPR) repeat protein
MNIAQEPSNLHVLSINESMSSHLISNILSLNICVDGMVTSVLLDDETLLLISNREGKVKKIGSVKNHYFCQVEPRVFVYETVDDDVLVVHICFFDEDLNLYTFEEMRLDPLNSKSIGVTTPTITILHDLSSADETSTNKISNNQMYRIQSRKMLGFEHCDMEDADNLTSTTMFYHQLSCGHLDKALALAKQINQKSLWKKLASQALRDRDTVVLKECSSPLGVEMKRKEMHDDLAIFGEIAVEIGMLEEAVNLYKDLDRKDLICDLFVSRRVWDRAFRAAEEDEVLKKSIHYYYGKYLEEKGDFEGASVQYGNSSLPERKLLLWRYERGILTTPQSLFEQIKNEENMSLPGLIAEYNGDLEEAERLFRANNDVANLIRLACGSDDNFEYKLETIPLQKESDFYQMGLVFEKQGDLPRAVEYLRKSGSLDHAIRIIKMLPEYIDLLVELALESKDALQKISCAEIIAKKGLFQKAARLFLDGGNVSKAKQIMKQLTDETLFQEDFSFQEKVEYVNLIDELDLDIPTKSVKACTKVLLKAKNEEKAIKFLLSKSLPLHNILSLLIENNVTLSKEKLNFLVKNSSDVDSIAQYLIQSKDFVGASELYSEKGDYVKGLKCLLKNDTPPAKIIEFASKSKSKEVFILAGNYLQTM